MQSKQLACYMSFELNYNNVRYSKLYFTVLFQLDIPFWYPNCGWTQLMTPIIIFHAQGCCCDWVVM
jgi:hypothetical protein